MFRSSKILISTSGYEIEIDSLERDVAERSLNYLKQVTHKSKIKDVIDSDDIATRQNTNSAEDSKISFSIADELEKLSKLKNENVISDEEFQMMKTDLFKRMSKQ